MNFFFPILRISDQRTPLAWTEHMEMGWAPQLDNICFNACKHIGLVYRTINEASGWRCDFLFYFAYYDFFCCKVKSWNYITTIWLSSSPLNWSVHSIEEEKEKVINCWDFVLNNELHFHYLFHFFIGWPSNPNLWLLNIIY